MEKIEKYNWTDENCLKLIQLYQKHPILWDPKHPKFKLTKLKYDSWMYIANEMNIDINEIKKKIDSLLTSFRRERQREGTTSGMGRDEVYHSAWFAFKAMSFLNDKFQPRKTQNTLQSEESYGTEIDNIATESDQESNIQTENIEDRVESSSQGPSENQHKKRKIFFSPKKVQSRKVQKEDPRIVEAYNVMQNIAKKKLQQSEKDESALFGEYVASQLRKFNPHTNSLVKHKINNILFEAEMGKYDQNQSHLYTLQSPLSRQVQHLYEQLPSNILPASYSQINQNNLIQSPQPLNPPPKSLYYSISQQTSPQSAVLSPSPVYNQFTQQSPVTQQLNQNDLLSETESSFSSIQ